MNAHARFVPRDWLDVASESPFGLPWIEDVKRAAADYYGVPISALLARRRNIGIVHRRHVAIFLACEMTGKSLPMIGRRFGLDHTTVIHARQKVAARIKAGDQAFIADVDAIRARVSRVSERKGVGG